MLKERVKWISKNQYGDYYVCYEVLVQRGIRGKDKGQVIEVLIVGVPKDKFKEFCQKHDIDYSKAMEELK